MSKEYLIIVDLVNGIGLSTDKSLQEMMEIGKNVINNFRQDPVNKDAMEEVARNTFNPDFKISQFGQKESMFLFTNNILHIFILHRETYSFQMPEQTGSIFWNEITNFYMTYTLASIYCLITQMTTMSDVSSALTELRTHFLEEFLIDYVGYLR